jgi:hypothetical protein
LRKLEFVGSSNADYQDFVLGKRSIELLPLLVRYLHEQRDVWDMMLLRNVPTDSTTFALLPAMMRSNGLGATDHERVACPTIEISSRPGDIRRLLDGYSTRRRIKQMKRHGDLNFTRCSTQEQLDRYLPQFFEQYVERRRGSAAAETFRRPEVQTFFGSLAKALLPHGWLHFSVLECAGRPVAFHFGFEFGERLYWYKPSFDPSVARLSPGTVLLSHLVQESLERGLAELDFTVGSEAFKYRYANTQRTVANLRVFGRRWLYFAAIGIFWLRRTAGRWRRKLRAGLSRPSTADRDRSVRASPGGDGGA